MFDFKRTGNLVTVTTRGDARLNPTSEFFKIGTVGNDFKPSSTVTAPMTWGSFANVTGLVRIETNGDIKIYASSAQSNVQGWCNFSYFVT